MCDLCVISYFTESTAVYSNNTYVKKIKCFLILILNNQRILSQLTGYEPCIWDKATSLVAQQSMADPDSSYDKLNYTYHRARVPHSPDRFRKLHHDCHP